MIWFRSLIFNSTFYSWTFLCVILFFPLLFLPRSFLLRVLKLWRRGVFWICEHIIGLYVKTIGEEKLLVRPAIIAAKHQSTWETIVFHHFVSDPSIVLKQELLWIPLFGWYLKKLGMIPLSRSKSRGIQDLKNLLKESERAVAQGRPLLIFPEGTRSKPGQKGTYQSGVASLYLHLNIPVIPIAHNAGVYWPRRGFVKYPGCIIMKVLDPIEPGLSRQKFMRILENRIETTTNDLVHEGLTYVANT